MVCFYTVLEERWLWRLFCMIMTVLEIQDPTWAT